MSMSGGAYRVGTASSKSKAMIKYALYVVLSGMLAFYLKEPLVTWAEEMNIPFSGDILATFVSIAMGLLITTMMLSFYEKSMNKGM